MAMQALLRDFDSKLGEASTNNASALRIPTAMTEFRASLVEDGKIIAAEKGMQTDKLHVCITFKVVHPFRCNSAVQPQSISCTFPLILSAWYFPVGNAMVC